LARLLEQQRLPGEARRELLTVLEQRPQQDEARRLLDQVERQLGGGP
jgi:hypothetical protein